jgi:hypothetical protein
MPKAADQHQPRHSLHVMYQVCLFCFPIFVWLFYFRLLILLSYILSADLAFPLFPRSNYEVF